MIYTITSIVVWAVQMWTVGMSHRDRQDATRFREVAVISGSQEGLNLAGVGGMAVTPDGDLFVADPVTNSLYFISIGGDSISAVAGQGNGPGEFVRVGRLIMGNDGLDVVDPGQGLNHSFTFKGEFVGSRQTSRLGGVPLVAVYDMQDERRVAVSSSTFTWNPASGKVDSPGRVMVLEGDSVVRTLLEYETVTAIWYDRQRGLPWRPAIAGLTQDSGHWAVVSDSVVALTDALSGIAEAYCVSGDAVELAWRLDTELSGRLMTDADQRDVIDAERSMDPRLPRNVGWDFPERFPGIRKMIADSDGFLWLRKGIEGAQGEAGEGWRVVAPNGETWTDILVPRGLDVRAISGNRVFGVTRDSLDVPVIRVLEFDRSRLLPGLAVSSNSICRG